MTRRSAGRDQQLWYYGALADQFSARRTDLGEPAGPLIDELQRVVAELGRVSAGGDEPRAGRQIGVPPHDPHS